MEALQRSIERFTRLLSQYTAEEREAVLDAARWGAGLHQDQKRASGQPYFVHPLAVAETLTRLRLDHRAVIAALLHDVLEDTAVTGEELKRRFGREVHGLVDGVTKISMIRAKSKSLQNAETIRKMLFAMVKDIRVILIKLADKLHNMQTLEYLDLEKSRKIAAECLDIYAPLAGRLGISWIKDELEDLSLKTLHPSTYTQIKRYVADKREQRASYLEEVSERIARAAQSEKIPVDIKTRAKHFYSIYQKMKTRSKGLDEIYDMLGIRVFCRTTVECYTLLGIVHRLWKPLTGRFKDYIAMPKANRYQSLHTTVMGQDGRLIEIQIRTHEMNRTAEYGIAAHWLYKQKEGAGRRTAVRRSDGRRPGGRPAVAPRDTGRGGVDQSSELTIINKLRSWGEAAFATSDFLQEIRDELLKDSIYVFTPKGDVVELPAGSTPIDFAYSIHTEVGHRAQGARVNGHIHSLRKPLRNTEVVEIITSPHARPHLDWLRSAKTHRARSKIRQRLNRHDESLIIDRNIVVKKREKAPPTREDVSPAARDSSPMQIMDRQRVGIRIGRDRNIMVRLAGCCNPTPGDRIVGYVSRGRGIIVHREDCSNLAHIRDFHERRIEVEWETISAHAVRRFRITARSAENLFTEIEAAIRKYEGHLVAGKLFPNAKGTLTGYFTIELDRGDQFKMALKKLRTLPSIVNIQPTQPGAPRSTE